MKAIGNIVGIFCYSTVLVFSVALAKSVVHFSDTPYGIISALVAMFGLPMLISDYKGAIKNLEVYVNGIFITDLLIGFSASVLLLIFYILNKQTLMLIITFSTFTIFLLKSSEKGKP